MSDEGLIAAKVINGQPITAAERERLTPGLLVSLAIGRHLTLTPAERDRISEGPLSTLAISGIITLTRAERDRLSPGVLASLAISRCAKLDADELNRFEPAVRMIVQHAIADFRPSRIRVNTLISGRLR